MQWADARVWQAIFASEAALPNQKITEYFYHLHLVQRAFLRAWRGDPRDNPFPKFDDAQSLRLWGQAYYSEIFEHLEKLTEEETNKAAADFFARR